MRTLFILFSFILLSLSVEAKHPTHISVVNMQLNVDSLKIDYSIRLFQDDLFHLITGLYHQELFHSSDTFDLNLNMEKIENYFSENLTIIIENKALEPILKTSKNNETEYWLYYSIILDEIPTSLKIENQIFLDLYSDQTNLLIFSYNKKEKGLTFNKQNTTQFLSLDNI